MKIKINFRFIKTYLDIDEYIPLDNFIFLYYIMFKYIFKIQIGKLMYKYKTILAPVDFSDGSDNALNHAKDIAKSMDATIHIVHVISPIFYPTGIEFISEDLIQAEKDLEIKANDKLQDIKSTLDEQSIKSKIQFLRGGNASTQILAYADDEDIDLICIATHGSSGFERFLFGSTTEKIIRKAKCPVLVVRQK